MGHINFWSTLMTLLDENIQINTIQENGKLFQTLDKEAGLRENAE
jgi:hypothetical protein